MLNLTHYHIYLSILLVFCIPRSTLSQQEYTSQNEIDSLLEVVISFAKKGDYIESQNIMTDLVNRLNEDNIFLYSKLLILRGDISRRMGHFQSSQLDYSTILAKVPKDISPDSSAYRNRLMAKNGLGSLYRINGEYEKSIDFFKQSLNEAFQYFKPNHDRIGYIYANIANAYWESKQYEEASHYYEKASSIFEQSKSIKASFLSNFLNNIAKTQIKTGDFGKAEKQLHTSIKYQLDDNLYNSTPLLYAYNYLALLNLKKHNYEKTEYYLEIMMQTMDFVPDDKTCYDKVVHIPNILNLFSTKLDLYIEKYNISNLDEDFIEGKKWAYKAEGFLRYLKIELLGVYDRIALLDLSYEIYQKIIELFLLKPNLNQNELEEVFSFSEKNRSNLLREAVQESHAKTFSGIPDSLTVLEDKLKKNIVSYSKKLNSSASSYNDKVSLQQKIADNKAQYKALLAKYKELYPKYFELKYQHNIPTIDHVKNSVLLENQALVEYIIGDSKIFALVVDAKHTEVYEIGQISKIEPILKKFKNAIVSWRPNMDESNELKKQYIDSAYELYQLLIGKLPNWLFKKDLLIIPDGLLFNIPFDALLYERTNLNSEFHEFPFLVKQQLISYSYSISFLQEMLSNTDTGQSVLGFAPSFGSKDNEEVLFRYLKHSDKELHQIHDLVGGNMFYGLEASLDKFKDLAKESRIIHLATHGKAIPNNDRFSFLVFAPKTENETPEFLYVGDLYNLKLKADMVVLSACETGVGKLLEGEGVLSLARGFSYAGAKSLVSTLWSVDDASTLKIMNDFYRQLKKGDRKDEALRNAKLKYLENAKFNEGHPLYWSAWVTIGNMEQQQFYSSYSYFWIFIGIGIFGLLFWLYKRFF